MQQVTNEQPGEAVAPSVDEVQHGGDHYKQGGAMQHWNMLLMVGFGWEYYCAAATKYASRYHKKNGVQDVEKAIHFVDKLLDSVIKELAPPIFETRQGLRLSIDSNPVVPYTKMVNVEQLCEAYFAANGIDNTNARKAIRFLFEARTSAQLIDAKHYLRLLLDDITAPTEKPAEPTAAERQAASANQAANTIGVSDPLAPVGAGEAGTAYTNQGGETAAPAKPKRKSTSRKAAKPE